MSYYKQYKIPLPEEDRTLCIVCTFMDKNSNALHTFWIQAYQTFLISTCKCDLDVQACDLVATCHLIMVNMCAQSLGNYMMHGFSFRPLTAKCDLDILGTGLV